MLPSPTKKSALIIGSFLKTEHSFTGKLETLAIKGNHYAPAARRQEDSHPEHVVLHGQNEIGAAWNRKDDRGFHGAIALEEGAPDDRKP
jgi:uncharacterized protein (DUF736 family)